MKQFLVLTFCIVLLYSCGTDSVVTTNQPITYKDSIVLLATPTNGTSFQDSLTDVRFSWFPNKYGNKYALQWSNDSTFTYIQSSDGNISDTFKVFPNSSFTSGKYYWRISIYNLLNTEHFNWSEVWHFTKP